jgi:tetratricopeptide (TPR) repeat protein
MNFRAWAKYLVIFIFCATAFSQQAANPRAQAALDEGIAQYKAGKYKDATLHLRKALRIDSEFLPAHLCLAKALTEQFEPGLKTPKNLAFATEAEQEFKELLKRQPQNVEGLKGLAKLKEKTEEPEEARRHYAEANAADTKDVEAYTALGRLDYRRTVQKMNTSAVSGTQSSPIDHPLCKVLRAENLQALEAAIAELKKAVELHQQNGTAAYYLSLAYGARSRLECGDPKASDADSKESAVWLDRAMKWPSYPEGPSVLTAVSL